MCTYLCRVCSILFIRAMRESNSPNGPNHDSYIRTYIRGALHHIMTTLEPAAEQTIIGLRTITGAPYYTINPIFKEDVKISSSVKSQDLPTISRRM